MERFIYQYFNTTKMEGYRVHVTREETAGRNISFRKGYSQMFPGVKERPDFDVGLKDLEYLATKVKEYETISRLPNGVDVDNRKYKMSRPEITGNSIIIPLGVTHWQDYSNDINGAENNQLVKIRKLIRLGEANFDDPLAYFASPLGIEVLPITADGYAVFIPRNPGKQQFFIDEVNAAATFMKYRPDKRPENLTLDDDIARVFRDKLGIQPSDFHGASQLIGIASDILTGGTAVMFLQRLGLRSEHLDLGSVLLLNDINRIKELDRKLESPAPYFVDVLAAEDIEPL
jgi:hypothetical protein